MNYLISTYDNLLRNLQQFRKIKRKTSNEIPVVDLDGFLKKHERRLYQIQNIVLWDSPIRSFAITLVLTFIFYFLSYCTWKFFASLFSILLVLSVGEVWVDRIWPEIAVESPTADDWLPVNERALSAAEISQQINIFKQNMDKYWKWLINLRKDKPSIFCLSTSFILFGLVLVTWSISGLTLAYLTLLGILCGPALIVRATGSKIVQDYVKTISDYLKAFKDSDVQEELEEKILPQVTEDNKKLLDIEDSSCDSHFTPDISLETIGNLSDLGVPAMPAYDDSSLDSLGYSQDEFALHQGEPAELSDADTDSSPSFSSPKTKGSSNTSSSASLVHDAKDLDDVNEQDYSSTPTSQTLNLSNLLTNMSKSLWTTQPTGSAPEPTVVRARIRRHSTTTTDDDSEFEMVEHSDIFSS